MGEQHGGEYPEMTDEERREELRKIINEFDGDRIRFWHRYIMGIEKGRC